jgi:predicted small lipoprotein YifL
MKSYPFPNLAQSISAFVLVVIVALSGCGSKEPIVPRDVPAVAVDRYKQVEVRIDGQVVRDEVSLSVASKKSLTVSFQRTATWPDLDNREASIEMLFMDGRDSVPTIYGDADLDFASDQNGLLTYTGELVAPAKPGKYGLWLREHVVSSSIPGGIDRYFLFVSKATVSAQ